MRIDKQTASQFICIAIFLSIPFLGNTQEVQSPRFYGPEYFILEGNTIPDSLKENRYDRLPHSYKEIVRKPVWELSKASAGMSIRFFSNSTSISVKWTVMNDASMNHMAETGIKGVDLYYKNNDTWQYLNTARPTGIDNEYLLISNMSTELREFKMYLPLYDGVVDMEVGIDSSSVIEKPLKSSQRPIVFYGTSITQGGCASRPGMAHTNIISRKLDIDCINYGFSGNGRMEQPIAQLISTIDPAFYVIECLPNMHDAAEIKERTIPLVKTIRAQHPQTPIVLVENFLYEPSVLDEDMDMKIGNLNSALKEEYTKLIESGYVNIFYIESENATGVDHEGTVDGVHFTDLGFMRYADFLIAKFAKFGLITEEGN